MRNLNQTFIRLLTLSAHFNRKNVKEKYTPMRYIFSDDGKNIIIGNGNGKYYAIYPFVIYELPLLFAFFKIDENGYVIFTPAKKLDIYYAVMEYLGLSVDEFLHLFSVGIQKNEKYGGVQLTVESTSKDVAHNIDCLLEYTLKERKKRENLCTSKLIIEKITQVE